ncbi:MAG: PAS domain-containing protein [Gammaproteobacteria bacterium]
MLLLLGLSPMAVDGLLLVPHGLPHLFALALSLGLTWWLIERWGGVRIDALMRAARAVADGDLEARAAVRGVDEIAALGRAFNVMVGTLAERAHELGALRQAIDAHAIVSITDAAGDITYANDRFCEISGYSREELLGQNHRLLKSDAHPDAVYRGLWRSIRAGRAWHGVLQNRRKDGTPYWVQSSILPLVNAANGHDGYISLRTDITERERLRLALDRLSQPPGDHDTFDLFASALGLGLDAAVAGVVRFVEGDTRMIQLGGWPERATTAEMPLAGCAAAVLAQAEPIVLCGEIDAAFPDDPWLAGHTQGYLFVEPLLDRPGQPLGMLYALCDVAPRDEGSVRALLRTVARRAASEIAQQSMMRAQQRQQAWLEFVIKGAGAAVWDWDLVDDSVRFNDQWAAMLGYELAALEPHVSTWERLVHPEDKAATLAAVAEHLAGQSEHYESQHRLLSADGRYVWVLDRGTVTARAPDGRPLRMSGVHLSIDEMKLAQAELALEQRRLELILDSVPIGLWELDLESGVVRGSRQWLARLGIDDGARPQHRAEWGRLMHPEDQPRVRAAMDDYVAGRSASYAVDYRVRAGDGRWHWILSRGVISALDQGGRPARVTGMHVDVQEQREAEQRIRENEQRLQLVLKAGDLGVWDWNIATGELAHNDRMTAMLGYASGTQALHADWRALVHPDDLAASRTELVAHLRGDQAFYSCDMRVRTATGDWRWIASRGQVVARSAEGRALRMMGIHIDVNDRRLAELALRVSETRLQVVLENSPIGIYWMDQEGALLYLNAALRENVGVTLESGRDWVAHVHPDDRARVAAEWQTFAIGSDEMVETTFRFISATRGVRVSQSRVARVHVPGTEVGFIGTMEDVTERMEHEKERERLQLQIQQAQKMEAVGQLAGGIAHDFNNILASVIGFGTLARERYADVGQGKLAEYLAAVVAAGERGRDLVAKMLAFSRAAPAAEAQAVDANAVAREVTQMLRAIIPSSLEFQLVTAEDTPPALIGAVELHQLLVNLVVNARDAVGSHGHITLAVEGLVRPGGRCAACHTPIEGEYVAISVRDDGDGMDERIQARVFDPFFSTKPVGKGTGMGLSVVHGIVHRVGGHVLLRSAPGRGTTFTLLLRRAGCVVDAGSAPAPRDAGGIRGLRVLVVDDEPLVRNLLGELLSGEGADATLAVDGQQARELFLEAPERFDVVFSDQTMPGLTGLELAAALRATRPALPVVVYSGYSDGASRDIAQAGGVHFLAKPAEPQAIVQALREAVTSPPTPIAPRRAADVEDHSTA